MTKYFLYYIIPISLLFDISFAFLPDDRIIGGLRAVMLFSLIVPIIFKKIGNIKYYRWLLIYVFYVFLNVLLSSEVLTSLSISSKVVVSMLFFIVGFNYFNNQDKLFKLLKSLPIVYFLLIANFLISTYFGIGIDSYTDTDNFLAGNLNDNWNLFTYSLMLFPLLIYFISIYGLKFRKYFLYILSILAVGILILSIKRIAISGLFVGLFIYAINNYSFSKIAKFGFIFIFLLIISYPFYGELLTSRFKAREDRFEDGALEKEARYLETLYVWEEVFSFEKPIKSFFGLEGFNSVGNYANGKFGNRNLHVDYNLIVNTIGLVGLILYFQVFIQFYRIFRRFRKVKYLIEESYYNALSGAFYALLITSFLTSLGGQIYAITFRLIIFIFLGAILGNFYSILYLDENNEGINRL